MTIFIRAGLVVIAIVSIVVFRLQFVAPLSIPCETAINWSDDAPHGAIWKEQTVQHERVPNGYTTLVGWVNATTSLPCTDVSAVAPKVEIRKIRILAQNEKNEEFVLVEVDPRESNRFVGRLFPRVPHWFGETEGRNEIEIKTAVDDRISLDLGRVPLRVYHAWTNPRMEIDPAYVYVLEVEANITETARLQFGIDYWRDMQSDYAGWDATCQRSNNCEGLVSDWYGDTGGEFRTFRAPVSASQDTLTAVMHPHTTLPGQDR